MTAAHEVEAWRPQDSLANRIILLRHNLDLSQEEFCAQTGITKGVLQGMESGRAPRNEAATLARIALATGVDREWLAFGGPLGTEKTPQPGGPGGNMLTKDYKHAGSHLRLVA